MFTDTHSLCYEIKTDDVYKDLFHDKGLFDNSDYPKYSDFFFDENKKVIGKMKHEAAGMVIKEFIGLRSKMYEACSEIIETLALSPEHIVAGKQNSE